MKYERLTEWDIEGWGEGLASVNGKTSIDKDITLAINRFAELEDDLESGKVVRFPCKVGDKVYIDERVYRHPVFFNHIIVGLKFLVVGRVTSIRITKKQILMRVKAEYAGNPFRYKEINFPISAIGKTVFLTREEAEKRLKELQE